MAKQKSGLTDSAITMGALGGMRHGSAVADRQAVDKHLRGAKRATTPKQMAFHQNSAVMYHNAAARDMKMAKHRYGAAGVLAGAATYESIHAKNQYRKDGPNGS